MNVENNGRRELAQWKVAMPVGSESHRPLLRTRLLVELLESPFSPSTLPPFLNIFRHLL